MGPSNSEPDGGHIGFQDGCHTPGEIFYYFYPFVLLFFLSIGCMRLENEGEKRQLANG
jgi:hypothetical protein